MAHTSIYLNFMGNAAEAFTFYKDVFQTEFTTPIMRMKDVPGCPELTEADGNKVMHVALPILGGTEIMATDMLECMGQKLVEGNNFTISLNPDTKEEADRLYGQLSHGGSEADAPHDEFWGYWGTCKDRFGVRWMFNVSSMPQNN